MTCQRALGFGWSMFPERMNHCCGQQMSSRVHAEQAGKVIMSPACCSMIVSTRSRWAPTADQQTHARPGSRSAPGHLA